MDFAAQYENAAKNRVFAADIAKCVQIARFEGE